MTDHSPASDTLSDAPTFSAKDLEWIHSQLRWFYGYHQGPRPRLGARIRHRSEGAGTIVSHANTDRLFVRYDNGDGGHGPISAFIPTSEPRLTLHQVLSWIASDQAALRDPVCISQLAGHFRGDNGAQYANRAAHLWCIHALCELRLFRLDNPKLMAWVNREILALPEHEQAHAPPVFDTERLAKEERRRAQRRTAEMEATATRSLAHALELGAESIALAATDQGQQVDGDLDGLERTLATDLAQETPVVIVGRSQADHLAGTVDVIDLDTLLSYSRHISGLSLGDNVMNPEWFWDVITQSTIKHPTGTVSGWWSNHLLGPNGQEVDEPARRQVAMFAHLMLLRHAAKKKAVSAVKKHLKRARELSRTFERVERNRFAAVAPELVAPDANIHIVLSRSSVMGQHFKKSVEALLEVLPVPAATPVAPPSGESLAIGPPLETTLRPESTPQPPPTLKPPKVTFKPPNKTLRFQFTEHLLLASEWHLVETPEAQNTAVSTALWWLERRMGTSLPKHWREGAHEIERAGVSLQIEASPSLFAFRLEHPDLDQPTRWWRVEATVLQGHEGNGGMVGIRMLVRDLVDLPPPQRSVPALIRAWASKPGLRVARARTSARTKIIEASQLEQLHRIVQRRGREAPVWVTPLGSDLRLSNHSPLMGLGRLIFVASNLPGYAERYGPMQADTLHIFAPGRITPEVLHLTDRDWQTKLALLALDMRHKPETPSFRDVRDAIHRHRIERAGAAAAVAVSVPLTTAQVYDDQTPVAEFTESPGQTPLPPSSGQLQAVPVEMHALTDGHSDDEDAAHYAENASEFLLDPAVTDARQASSQARMFEDLLDAAEIERDKALLERDQARAEAVTLRHTLQQLQGSDAAPPSHPETLADLPTWTSTIASRVVFADKAIKFATKAIHNEVSKIYASLQALAEHYWVTRFGEDGVRDQAYETWNKFLQDNRLRWSPVGRAAEDSRYQEEYKATINGDRYTACMHLAGNSTHDTQRCLRIYLDVDEANKRLVIIHLPTHLTSAHT